MLGKILIVDDDVRINQMLVDVLELEGFATTCAYNGQEALDILKIDNEIAVVILDVMMPVLDGWDILKYIKDNYDVKIIMLTALCDEKDEVRGLREGADDYIAKPFSRAVLVERIKKMMDSFRSGKPEVICFHEIEINRNLHTVKIGHEMIDITNKEYQLLLLLLEHKGMILSREAIITKIWGYDSNVEERNVDTQIKMLRHSLGRYGKCIKTVRGIGYYFDEEVVVK